MNHHFNEQQSFKPCLILVELLCHQSNIYLVAGFFYHRQHWDMLFYAAKNGITLEVLK